VNIENNIAIGRKALNKNAGGINIAIGKEALGGSSRLTHESIFSDS
jgi:hypothetical protein